MYHLFSEPEFQVKFQKAHADFEQTEIARNKLSLDYDGLNQDYIEAKQSIEELKNKNLQVLAEKNEFKKDLRTARQEMWNLQNELRATKAELKLTKETVIKNQKEFENLKKSSNFSLPIPLPTACTPSSAPRPTLVHSSVQTQSDEAQVPIKNLEQLVTLLQDEQVALKNRELELKRALCDSKNPMRGEIQRLNKEIEEFKEAKSAEEIEKNRIVQAARSEYADKIQNLSRVNANLVTEKSKLTANLKDAEVHNLKASAQVTELNERLIKLTNDNEEKMKSLESQFNNTLEEKKKLAQDLTDISGLLEIASVMATSTKFINNLTIPETFPSQIMSPSSTLFLPFNLQSALAMATGHLSAISDSDAMVVDPAIDAMVVDPVPCQMDLMTGIEKGNEGSDIRSNGNGK